MMDHTISAEQVAFSYGDHDVLQAVTLAVEPGGILGLLGPSGAGKTTFLKLLTGQLRGYRGRLQVLGYEAERLTQEAFCAIGIMMDDLGVYGRLTAKENLDLVVKLRRLRPGSAEAALQDVGLYEARNTPADKLSKGMKSRLALARALLTATQLLVLDEPTTGLDPISRAVIHRLLVEKRASGTTILLSTHDMQEASELCGRVALLHEGRIVESGSPDEIMHRHDSLAKIRVTCRDGRETLLPRGPEGADPLADLLRRDSVQSVHSTEPTLEAVFIEETGRGFLDA